MGRWITSTTMEDLLMKHIAPGLGCIIAWMVFLSPWQAVMQCRHSKSLGCLNPLPFIAMVSNCTAWLVYSFITTDVYVLASNIPGLLLALFMTFSSYGYADEKARNTMLQGMLLFTALLMGAGTLVSFGHYDHKAVVNIWGSTTVFILLVFYSAPLSVLAEVFRTRTSAQLHLPFAVMNMINGILWSVYGLAVPDAFIYGPNLVGAVFGGLQVVLCLVFPSKERYKQPSPLPDEVTELGGLCAVRE